MYLSVQIFSTTNKALHCIALHRIARLRAAQRAQPCFLHTFLHAVELNFMCGDRYRISVSAGLTIHVHTTGTHTTVGRVPHYLLRIIYMVPSSARASAPPLVGASWGRVVPRRIAGAEGFKVV